MNHHFYHGSLLRKAGKYCVHIVHVWQEACTHVAALLFWVEVVIKNHSSKTVTDKQAYWISPSNSDTFLQPEMLFSIDFRSPQFKKKSIEKHNSSSTVPKDGLNSFL